nr:hypothetical protein [Anaerolineaceae bacterium]
MSRINKWQNFSISSLNSQLFIFVILPISILLLIITFGSKALHQDAMRNLVGVRDQRTVQSAASAIQEQLNHRAAAIQGIAIRVNEADSLNKILDSVEFLMADFDIGLAFFDQDGIILGNNGDESIWIDLRSDLSPLVPILIQRIEEKPIFSDAFFNEARGEYYCLVLFQSIPDAPIAAGVFSVNNLVHQTLSEDLSYKNQGAVILVDQNRNLLYKGGTLDLSDTPDSHPGVSDALSGESGTTFFRDNEGEHVVAFSPIDQTNWALVIEETWDTLASPLLRYSESGSLVLVPIVILSLFALWFGTRQIIQPLNSFRQQAESFSMGDYTAFDLPVGGINEIQVLHATFVDMAEEVENAQQTLKQFLGMITRGQEDERKRLARELHDETLQSLIALNQRVMMVQRKAQGIGVEDALLEIETMIGQTMHDLRRLTRGLRPIYMEDLGMVTALKILAQETSQTSNITVNFNVFGVER